MVIASGADLILNIGAVMLVSFFIGWISTSGFNYFSRYLQTFGFYDTAGTLNLFLLPGIFSGVFSALFAAAYTSAPKSIPLVTVYAGRTSVIQGCFQIACLCTTIAFAAVFGILTGLLLKKIAVYHKEDLFDDQTYFLVPTKEEE